jgi:hypothetical protein
MSEVTITIDESGNMLFLDTGESADAFKELGTVTTKRASHVYPAQFWKRQAFKLVRLFVKDDSASAEWCRRWQGPWMVDMSPIGGSILRGCDYMGDWVLTWDNRQDAIDAEIIAVNEFFLRRIR